MRRSKGVNTRCICFIPASCLCPACERLEYINKVYTFIANDTTMKNLSLKLDDDIFDETEKIVARVQKTRNRYINEAIDFYNRLHRRGLLSKQLARESKLVASDSMEVLAEFEKLHDED